ncbi:MAG: hypothetical protein JHD07_02665 [Bradyrhizobium sp.]|jgi:hypothetical protein|uniref:hypothetical protein n=1 Tax=Bradyrhizobium sp. TaxID=376 RepID=UPI001A2952D3|nr:hypothetical protein [Bradyrhizobium sp.]MBJ7402242.1 hypothetical protein [Bradyrhizobium sp.]
MRNIHFVFAGAIAAVAVLTAPVLAKDPDAQKGEDKSTSASCSAYQQAADGSWEPLPCKAIGERGQPQTQNRGSPQGADRGER